MSLTLNILIVTIVDISKIKDSKVLYLLKANQKQMKLFQRRKISILYATNT